jgi:hypothetical protein
MGLAMTANDGNVVIPQRSIAFLERQDVGRAGRAMASARGQIFRPTKPGEPVRGTLVGAANLTSGRFAILERFSDAAGFGFSLVPWHPLLDQRIGQEISGIMRDTGGVDWQLGRTRGLEL